MEAQHGHEATAGSEAAYADGVELLVVVANRRRKAAYTRVRTVETRVRTCVIYREASIDTHVITLPSWRYLHGDRWLLRLLRDRLVAQSGTSHWHTLARPWPALKRRHTTACAGSGWNCRGWCSRGHASAKLRRTWPTALLRTHVRYRLSSRVRRILLTGGKRSHALLWASGSFRLCNR